MEGFGFRVKGFGLSRSRVLALGLSRWRVRVQA